MAFRRRSRSRNIGAPPAAPADLSCSSQRARRVAERVGLLELPIVNIVTTPVASADKLESNGAHCSLATHAGLTNPAWEGWLGLDVAHS